MKDILDTSRCYSKKMEQLAEREGMTGDELIQKSVCDNETLGICVNSDCDFTMEVDPDESRAMCEMCYTHTVVSVLILAGMI